jgi:hypothetical protein
MPLALFEASGRLIDDQCAQKTRLKENQSQLHYSTYNARDDDKKKNYQKLAQKTKNLRPWNGYGWPREKIDADSQLRIQSVWTNTPYKTQLPTRTFVGAPDMSRGVPQPDKESELLNSQDTSSKTMCDPITEKQFPVYHPTLLPVCTRHIIPPWTRGGESSRKISSSPEFMRMLGYKYDGRMWVRNC